MRNRSHIDLTGETFGRLSVIKLFGRDNNGNIQWDCVCKCGNKATPTTSGLRSGLSTSCGCRSAEIVKTSCKTHGACIDGTPTPEYLCWQNMKARCNNPRHASYKNYGGRGIKVCARWNTFQNFIADMGTRLKGLSIERVNNNKGYSPKNCIWADRLTQGNNQRRKLTIQNGACKYGHTNFRVVKRSGNRTPETVCKDCFLERQSRYRAKKRHDMAASE